VHRFQVAVITWITRLKHTGSISTLNSMFFFKSTWHFRWELMLLTQLNKKQVCSTCLVVWRGQFNSRSMYWPLLIVIFVCDIIPSLDTKSVMCRKCAQEQESSCHISLSLSSSVQTCQSLFHQCMRPILHSYIRADESCSYVYGKVKLFLCLIEHHSINTFGGVGI
jgi:hypothetical protein